MALWSNEGRQSSGTVCKRLLWRWFGWFYPFPFRPLKCHCVLDQRGTKSSSARPAEMGVAFRPWDFLVKSPKGDPICLQTFGQRSIRCLFFYCEFCSTLNDYFILIDDCFGYFSTRCLNFIYDLLYNAQFIFIDIFQKLFYIVVVLDLHDTK